MQIIDGKAVSLAVKERVRDEIAKDGLKIGLAVVIVGNDQASRVYVNNKKSLRVLRDNLGADCSAG